jgi:hypothetical protein
MKKVVIGMLICILIFIIHNFNNKKEKLIFSIGSMNGDISYKKENSRITDLIIGIETNQQVGEYDFQYLLVKATTIDITISDFIILNSYASVVNQLNDLDKLIIILKKYNKEIIKIKLLDESSEIAEYVNEKISILCKKYDIIVTR